MLHRTPFAALAAAFLLAGCASPPPPVAAPEPRAPEPPLHSFPADYRPAVLTLAGTQSMAVERAGAALRPTADEHVLWPPVPVTDTGPAGADCPHHPRPPAAAAAAADPERESLIELTARHGGESHSSDAGLVLSFPAAITFRFDSRDLNPESFPALDELAAGLVAYQGAAVVVAGHTDNIGSAAYNEQLGEQRAATIRDYLASRGVAGHRMTVVSHGLHQPVASNATPEGRARNRRVELTITPAR